MLERNEVGPAPYGIPPPAFRLPDATHVGGVRLQVSDLQRSVDFYQRVLGLHLFDNAVETATLGVHAGDRPLVTLRTGTGVKPAQRGAFGLYHFAILLPDRAALGRFAAHVSALPVRVGMADHLVSEALYLSDPDGLGIEVYADRPRDSWRHHNRELAMATDPLDISSVISIAGGEAWTGMPPGTTMGHVHLHVGSIQEAEAFYHRALGFDKTVWSYPGALFLSAGGYHHHLATNIWSPGPRPSADRAQLLDWDLLVPGEADVAAISGSLRAAGYHKESSPHGFRSIDPWGACVRVLAEG